MNLNRPPRGEGRPVFLILAGATALLAGCTVRMTPPVGLAGRADEFEATERSAWSGAWVDESFRLGPYQVSGVDREWGGGHRSTVLGFTKDESRAGFAYELGEPPATVGAHCSWSSVRKSVFGFSRTDSATSRLECACAEGGSTATLEMDGRGANYTGRVAHAGRTLTVSSVYEVNGSKSLPSPVGFRIDDGGEPVGAAEVLRPSRIWLARALGAAERRQLACLLAGLILHGRPSED